MHYYNALPSPYHHRLEEKAIDNLGSALHTCSEYEEQLERTGLPQGESVRQTDMSALLQLVQDMNNRMIAFEWKGTVSPLTPGASSSSAPLLEIRLKTIFSLRLSCLGVGVTFARNTMKKPHVR
jgi:hypothetical protein